MKLKGQLLLVSLLMLLIPWAGCQFVREVEGVLRYGQTQSLQASAHAIAASLADKPELIYSSLERYQVNGNSSPSLYFSAFDSEMVVDGYHDGWPNVIPHTFERKEPADRLSIEFSAGFYEDDYILYFSVVDPDVIFYNPTLSSMNNGDRIILVMGGERTPVRQYMLSTAAPGEVVAKALHLGQKAEYGIRGVWQDTAEGFDLEMVVPKALMDHRFGFYMVNERAGSEAYSLGNLAPRSASPPPWIVQPNLELKDTLAVFGVTEATLTVVDKFGWIIARYQDENVSGLAPLSSDSVSSKQASHWLVKRLFRAILSAEPTALENQISEPGRVNRADLNTALNGEGNFQWYQRGIDQSRSLLAVAEPIYSGDKVIGALLIEQSSEEFLSLTENAFGRLLYISFMVMSLIGVGLLLYASLLSWRISRLSEAARNVMGENGVLQGTFPVSTARDELGDLSRNYGRLVSRAKQSSDYLRSLARTLSHELRTPIAIVRSSLDNLENESLSKNGSQYAARAKDGIGRLSYLLTAMSEANNVEASIENGECVEFDLLQLLRELLQAYQEIYSDYEFQVEGVDGRSGGQKEKAHTLLGVPELIVQMLDKLVENAVSFCPTGGVIKFCFSVSGGRFWLALSNEGPPLPVHMSGQLFESMVSVRPAFSKSPSRGRVDSSQAAGAEKETAHLGLGLYVARLIAEFHNGSIRADNLEDGSGVQFEVLLSGAQLNP